MLSMSLCSVPVLVLALALALVLATGRVQAQLGLVTMDLEGMRERCFAEELPERTVVLIKHEAEMIDTRTRQLLPNSPLNLLVTVRDPAGHTVIRQQGKPSGKVFMTSTLDGEYSICFQALPSQHVPNTAARLGLEIFIGDERDPRITAPIEVHLHDLSREIAENSNLVASIEIEQKLQREREADFRATSERVLSMTFWFAVVQTIVLVGTVAYQSRHLRKFFQYKKIV
jgi:hypothetical protein